MKILWFSTLVFAVAVLSSSARAHTKVYEFDLSGAAESPPVVTTGTGFARATFDLDLVTMRIEASFSDLMGNTTAAHIHCCDFNAQGNAGVATITPSFTGFPSGVTSGSYDNTFDMTLESNYRGAYLAANGGSVANALNALLADLDSGRAYFNVHTTSFQSGEIRGQASLVPEPAAAILVITGVGLPLLLRRSR
jgi:CHRD domain